jgi:hypothetical protein
MGAIFLATEPLSPELRDSLVQLNAQPVTSRGIDGTVLNDGYVIAAMSAATLPLLRQFLTLYFARRKPLRLKYKGLDATGYTSDELKKIIGVIEKDVSIPHGGSRKGRSRREPR